ncbi:MAG: alkaline shock response membrane anchor protein AmaP, partial [Clostridiales bacterium]|nr:alkaline shock response membrane anchor protein AmaP [Clostridiales bacterium]
VVENKLKIDLRVVIAEEANIPETTEALRTSLIDYIQTITGIQVSDVSILVSTEPEKKAEA